MKAYYAWVIALLACLTLMVSNGMSITGLPVYDESLLNEFGWDRGALKFRDMITFMLAGGLAPLAGVLIDRWGVRACMLLGWCILAVAYFFYAQLQSLSDLYWVHALLGMTLVLCGLNPMVILVSHWFTAKRGAAIGIALVGSSLGGAVMPQYGTYMIELMGWRDALLSALIFPALMMLLTLFFIRNRPQHIGMKPVGGVEEARTGNNLPGISYKEALCSRTFWALTIIAMTTFYTVLGVQAHLFLYMRDLEYAAQMATNAISIFFVCALMGKFLFGMLADFLNPKRVFYGNVFIMGLGAVCLASMKVELIWFAVIAFGLGWGGVYTMIQLSAMNNFGLRAAGKILGTITILDALGGGLGIWLTGEFYSIYGDYQLAFIVFAVLVLIAFVCVTQVGGANKGSASSHPGHKVAKAQA